MEEIKVFATIFGIGITEIVLLYLFLRWVTKD